MSTSSETKIMADAIIKAHDGQAYFNFTEVRKIIGCGENSVAALLHSHGIIVKRRGRCKMVSAYNIAEVMTADRIAPIDNTSRMRPISKSGWAASGNIYAIGVVSL